MRPSSRVGRFQIAVVLAISVNSAAAADVDRSASINQVTKRATMAERSGAAFDQISTVESGRSSVSQIDPSLALKETAETEALSAGPPAGPAGGCVLTPEQQSIVTSLEAQGKLPAGDCEMAAWLADPGGKSEADDRRSLAESVAAGAPELLGREADADRQAKEAEAIAKAEAVAAAVTVSIFGPPPGQ